MSPAIRFLIVAMAGWAGVRAASVGMIPGADLFAVGPREAQTQPARLFPALEASVPLGESPGWMAPDAVRQSFNGQAAVQAMPYYVRVPVPYAVASPATYAAAHARQPLAFAPASFATLPDIARWASVPAGLPPLPSASAFPTAPIAASFAPRRFDRLQLTAWAMLRGGQSTAPSPTSLASGGTLGGSQAGARLTYRFSPAIAASLRTTSAVGTSQSQVAAGVRLTPFAAIPVAFTAERRQAVGDYAGRSAFALFAEGGVFQKPLFGFELDGYAQAGVVGIRDRALFADGGLALTRPLFRNLSGGFGLWGGIQPGVHRVDAGPRLSYRVRPNVRVHLDWRQRLAGTASPGSGAAVTLAGDF